MWRRDAGALAPRGAAEVQPERPIVGVAAACATWVPSASLVVVAVSQSTATSRIWAGDQGQVLQEVRRPWRRRLSGRGGRRVMAYWECYYHLVWATKNREPVLVGGVEEELHQYRGARGWSWVGWCMRSGAFRITCTWRCRCRHGLRWDRMSASSRVRRRMAHARADFGAFAGRIATACRASARSLPVMAACATSTGTTRPAGDPAPGIRPATALFIGTQSAMGLA